MVLLVRSLAGCSIKHWKGSNIWGNV